MLRIRKFGLGLLLLSLSLLQPPAITAAAGTATFTLTVSSAYLHASPAFDSPRTYSMLQNQSFLIKERNAAGTWVNLLVPGATKPGAWVPTSFGQVRGNLSQVPPVGGWPTPTPTSPPQPSATPDPKAVYFTISLTHTLSLAAPNPVASPRQRLFVGQTFTAQAQNSARTWVQLNYGGAIDNVWVPLRAGTVQGNLRNLPITTPVTAPLSPTAGVAYTATTLLLPVVSPRAREIYQQGLTLGNNPHAFSKVGDCLSVTPFFLSPFDYPKNYRLGAAYAGLQSVITQFSGSFARESLAVGTGFSSATVLDPQWSPPQSCRAGESPLACEYRLQRPSLVIISLGTNDLWLTDAKFEKNLRQIIEASIQRGVLPILSTKGNNLEGDDRFNRLTRQLAAEYALPLWDFEPVARQLPQGGLADSYHPTGGEPGIAGKAFLDDPLYLQLGWPWRNLTALQVLDTVWRAVR